MRRRIKGTEMERKDFDEIFSDDDKDDLEQL